MSKKLSTNIDENSRVLITEEELEEFNKTAFKEYGKRLTDDQAFEQGSALLTLFDRILKQQLRNKCSL